MPWKYPLPPKVAAEKRRKYYEKLATDVDRSMKYFHSAARKGARVRNIEFTITQQDVIDLWYKQNGCCALSGVPMTLTHGKVDKPNPTKVSIDRINNDLGYHKENIQLITWQVNCSKGAYEIEQLFEMCQHVVKYQKTLKRTSPNRRIVKC